MLFPTSNSDATGPLYTLTDVDVVFSYIGQELSLCCPTRAARVQELPVNGTSSVWTPSERGTHGSPDARMSLLRNADIWRLRSLLACHGHSVYRLNDRQVLDAVSLLVDRGTLGLFERVDGQTRAQARMSAASGPKRRPASGAPSLSPTQAFAPRAPVATPAQLRDARLSEHALDVQVQDKTQHWIEIQLIGEDDKPVPGERYTVRLPDGTLVPGYLDAHGFARLDGLEQAGLCDVCFPDLDREAWESLSSS